MQHGRQSRGSSSCCASSASSTHTHTHTHACNALARAHKQPYACKRCTCMQYILSTRVCVCVCVCVGINVALLLCQKPSQGFFAHLRQQMDCLDLAYAAAAAADTVRSFSPTDDLHFHTRSEPAAPNARRRAAPRR